jgi:hypothetical protein
MTRRRLVTVIPCRGGFAGRTLTLLVVLAASMAAVESTSRRELNPRLQYDDLARLASSYRRVELSCEVVADKPSLGFDLRFHSGYHITVPVKVLAEAGGWLQAAMRVTSTSESEQPVSLLSG